MIWTSAEQNKPCAAGCTRGLLATMREKCQVHWSSFESSSRPIALDPSGEPVGAGSRACRGACSFKRTVLVCIFCVFGGTRAWPLTSGNMCLPLQFLTYLTAVDPWECISQSLPALFPVLPCNWEHTHTHTNTLTQATSAQVAGLTRGSLRTAKPRLGANIQVRRDAGVTICPGNPTSSRVFLVWRHGKLELYMLGQSLADVICSLGLARRDRDPDTCLREWN